jgi:hypothetical protein
MFVMARSIRQTRTREFAVEREWTASLFSTLLRVILVAMALAACGTGPSGPALTFDPCQPVAIGAPSVTADQRASIGDAFTLWSTVGIANLAMSDSPEVTIVFKAGSTIEFGFYDPTTATVYVNTEVTDPTQRAIVLAHELGHSFGLVHVPVATRPSVMNPGNLTVAPTQGDTAALAAIWGSCPP